MENEDKRSAEELKKIIFYYFSGLELFISAIPQSKRSSNHRHNILVQLHHLGVKIALLSKMEEKKSFITNVFERPMQNRTFCFWVYTRRCSGFEVTKINLWIIDFW